MCGNCKAQDSLSYANVRAPSLTPSMPLIVDYFIQFLLLIMPKTSPRDWYTKILKHLFITSNIFRFSHFLYTFLHSQTWNKTEQIQAIILIESVKFSNMRRAYKIDALVYN